MAQIDHPNSTLCLVMKDASTAAGGRVIQQTCKEANEQMWQPVSRGLRDFVSGDSTDDILAVEYTNNKLWLYPGLGGAEFGTRLQRDTGGWHTMRDLAAGDFNNDGKDDLLAVHAATGNLRFYSGPDNTTQFRKHTVISAEFTGKNNLVGVDMASLAGDELLVSDLATGSLSLFIVFAEKTFRAWSVWQPASGTATARWWAAGSIVRASRMSSVSSSPRASSGSTPVSVTAPWAHSFRRWAQAVTWSAGRSPRPYSARTLTLSVLYGTGRTRWAWNKDC